MCLTNKRSHSFNQREDSLIPLTKKPCQIYSITNKCLHHLLEHHKGSTADLKTVSPPKSDILSSVEGKSKTISFFCKRSSETETQTLPGKPGHASHCTAKINAVNISQRVQLFLQHHAPIPAASSDQIILRVEKVSRLIWRFSNIDTVSAELL